MTLFQGTSVLKATQWEVSCVVSCNLEWGQREQGSGPSQSSPGRTSRHEMDYTHSRTKRNKEKRAETLVCRHVSVTNTHKDRVNLKRMFCGQSF